MRAEELTLLVVVATAVVGCDEDGDNPFQQNVVIELPPSGGEPIVHDDGVLVTATTWMSGASGELITLCPTREGERCKRWDAATGQVVSGAPVPASVDNAFSTGILGAALCASSVRGWGCYDLAADEWTQDRDFGGGESIAIYDAAYQGGLLVGAGSSFGVLDVESGEVEKVASGTVGVSPLEEDCFSTTMVGVVDGALYAVTCSRAYRLSSGPEGWVEIARLPEGEAFYTQVPHPHEIGSHLCGLSDGDTSIICLDTVAPAITRVELFSDPQARFEDPNTLSAAVGGHLFAMGWNSTLYDYDPVTGDLAEPLVVDGRVGAVQRIDDRLFIFATLGVDYQYE